MFSYPMLLSDSQKVIGNFRLFSFEISGTVSRSKKYLIKLGLRAYWENRLLATESNCEHNLSNTCFLCTNVDKFQCFKNHDRPFNDSVRRATRETYMLS